jgi:hypothetical protein
LSGTGPTTHSPERSEPSQAGSQEKPHGE